MGGRGSGSRMSGGRGNTVEPVRTLVSKSQVDELTKDYTPEQFLGDVSVWTGTANGARALADSNMPDSLDIGGYTFERMGDPSVSVETSGRFKNRTMVVMDYQSNERIGDEYPVLQVGVSIRRYRGKIQTEIVRDSPTYGTRFW